MTEPRVSVGHHYTIMDFNARRIVSVETASHGRHSIKELCLPADKGLTGDEEGRAFLFHANAYMRLDVPQVANEMSVCMLPTAPSSFYSTQFFFFHSTALIGAVLALSELFVGKFYAS